MYKHAANDTLVSGPSAVSHATVLFQWLDRSRVDGMYQLLGVGLVGFHRER